MEIELIRITPNRTKLSTLHHQRCLGVDIYIKTEFNRNNVRNRLVLVKVKQSEKFFQ